MVNRYVYETSLFNSSVNKRSKPTVGEEVNDTDNGSYSSRKFQITSSSMSTNRAFTSLAPSTQRTDL